MGGGTLRADRPKLDVRLAGLEHCSPSRWVLTSGAVPEGWNALPSPQAVHGMADVQYLFIEGGAQTAAAFLQADLGLAHLADAHGRWRATDRRVLGKDVLDVYEALEI